MNIIILGKSGHSRRINLAGISGMLMILSTCALLAGGGGFVGYRIAADRLADQPLEDIQSFREEMDAQRSAVSTLREEAQENLNALSVRLGELSAHIIRLD